MLNLTSSQQIPDLKENKKKDKKTTFFLFQALDEVNFEKKNHHQHQRSIGHVAQNLSWRRKGSDFETTNVNVKMKDF